ncbi:MULTISPECIES: hypothetical protein [unclassified Acinetobacter]|uniref:hypothetical protein n=1 Tax=unclassified Acinetobacter TaxID=196816 RepID=UPI0015D1B6F5|nr:MULTISPECIES: hypothetical protein [unclassified Acinetobacter]
MPRYFFISLAIFLILFYWGIIDWTSDIVRESCTHGNCKHGWYSKYNSEERNIAVLLRVIFFFIFIAIYYFVYINKEKLRDWFKKYKEDLFGVILFIIILGVLLLFFIEHNDNGSELPKSDNQYFYEYIYYKKYRAEENGEYYLNDFLYLDTLYAKKVYRLKKYTLNEVDLKKFYNEFIPFNFSSICNDSLYKQHFEKGVTYNIEYKSLDDIRLFNFDVNNEICKSNLLNINILSKNYYLEEDKLNSYIKDPNFYIWLKNKPANVKEMFDKCQNNKDYSCLDFIYLQFKDAN